MRNADWPNAQQAQPSARPRVVVHLDLDAFYASVEQLDRPELRGRPLLVGGSPNRGVVTTASYEARRFGIHSGMPTFQALQRCPGAMIVPPRFARYAECSRQVMDIVREAAAVTEQVSIDEAYLELTDEVCDWEAGVQRAAALQSRVMAEVGLSVSVGVAANRLVAKVASDRDKPGGFTIVLPGTEAVFLAPLPVRVLRGVGPVMARRLAGLGIITVGDLQAWSHEALWEHVGKSATWLLRQASGQDRRPVHSGRRRKSIGHERTFAHNVVQQGELVDQIQSLSESVARRLVRAEVSASTVALKIRYSDFTTRTRQMRLSAPSQDSDTIRLAAEALLRRAWQPGRPVRLLGVFARGLCVSIPQPRLLPTEGRSRQEGP